MHFSGNMPLQSDPHIIDQVQANKSDALNSLEHDREFFMQFYMSEHLIFAVPRFHIQIFDLMLSSSVSKLALAIPRGHNKTTLAKLAVVHYFLFTDYSFILYVSNTAEVAQAACRDIAEFITWRNNVSLFGEVKKQLWREGVGFYIFQIQVKSGTWKTCILRALGAGQQVRGLNVQNRRPELAVVDDLEDDENTETELLRRKLENWVYGAFLKAMNAWKVKIIWLGNMLNNKSLLKKHCDDPDWHSVRLGCILSNGQPLWPDLWPLEAIKKDFNSYKRRGLVARWFAEMMNLPMPEGGAIIDANDINYKPSIGPGDIRHGFITVDPAIGEKSIHDHTGICVHGWVDNHWQIAESIKIKADPLTIFNIIIALCQKWSIKIVGIEAVAFQAVLQFFFQYLLAQMPMNNIEVVKLTSTTKKTERIVTWCGMLIDGQYAINEGEY